MENKNPLNPENVNHWQIMQHKDDAPFIIRYFVLHYNCIPNYIKLNFEVNIQKVVFEFKQIYKDSCKVIAHFSDYMPNRATKLRKNGNGYLLKLKEELIVDIDENGSEIVYDNSISIREIATLKKILETNKIPQEPELEKFYMIKKGLEYSIDGFDIRPTKVNLEENYNDELLDIDERLTTFINSKNTNGMVLLHGAPGAGKTTYLRHLITTCNARFIYLPNNLFCQLSDPEFFTFILGYSNSVIILEDCEELLKPRDQNSNNNGISTLLNLSDGLLGDAMMLKIICTFNTELRNIDQALLRKGRLAHNYEFKPLSIEKTNNLLKKLNANFVSNEAMTLSDIYNYLHDNGKNEDTINKNKIGF